ncbi:MAG: PBP1A family penicillin-binding protein [Peptostreptococcales bacterium]
MTEEVRANRSQRKKQHHKKRKKKDKGFLNLIKKSLFLIIILGIFASIGVGYYTWAVIKDAEPIDPANLYDLLGENSFIVDQEGNLIEKVQSSVLRTNVKYEDIPPDLINAFISIEDKTFWEHKGFNVIRIMGAIWERISKGDAIGGTSTITQQLARNLYLPDRMTERSMNRKIKEAYYSIVLEDALEKEQIIEAYLNTIYLGFNAYGVQAASQAYFSKDISELSIAECAIIASIPKSPARYAPIKRLANKDVDPNNPNVISVGETYTLVYSEGYKDRQMLVLRFMKEFGSISEEEYEEAINTDIRPLINPSLMRHAEISSYYNDQLKGDVIDALMVTYKIDEKEASDMLYNAGLKIYGTIDINIQKIVEKQFADVNNFPQISARKNGNGDIIDSSSKIMLYKYSNLFNSEDQFVLPATAYKKDAAGNLVLLKNKHLIFDAINENNELKDIQISFKQMYKGDKLFSIIQGGRITIPNTFKSFDAEKNVIIDKAFLEKNPQFFLQSGDSLLVSQQNYSLNAEVIQPQASMVIMDQKTGHIKALVGGRNISGSMLYNRATNPIQPGSSIKPLGVYTPALDNGYTAGSIIDDSPLVNSSGSIWPSNWYSNPAFKGLMTLRYAVEQSVNVAAVKVSQELGTDIAMDYLKKFGISSLVETGGTNDNNSSALALGGMTRGISPLEMTAAYAALANKGTYIEPVTFTKIENKAGEIIYENKAANNVVVAEDVAFIMTDILESAVRSGTGSRAQIYSGNAKIPVAGKTGTTTNNYDACFMGYTPYYTAGMWIGNDINIRLSQGSTVSAQLWGKVMKEVHQGLPDKHFEKPSNVILTTIDKYSGMLPSDLSYADPRGNNIITEYFISGTQPTAIDDLHVSVSIDTYTNYLSTPACPSYLVTKKVMTRRPYALVSPSLKSYYPGDYIYEAPRYYCPLHNPSTQLYPVDPNAGYFAPLEPTTPTEPPNGHTDEEDVYEDNNNNHEIIESETTGYLN